MIKYRKPSQRDIERITHLEIECMNEIAQSVGDHFPLFNDMHNNQSGLMNIIEADTGYSLIAEDDELDNDDSIIGAIIALDNDMIFESKLERNEVVINNIFVRSDYREKGIGTSLLNAFLDWARSNDYAIISTIVYTPNNKIQKLLDFRKIEVKMESRRLILDVNKYKGIIETRDEQEEKEYEQVFLKQQTRRRK
jgi:GNAT superfamily N-acetyltransferase